MNFLRAFYITGATTVFVTLFGFLNNIVLTRYLGPEGRGQYSIIINLMTLLYLLFGEGIRRTNTIIIGNDKNQLNYTLLLSIKYFILVSILFLIAYYFNPLWIDLFPNIDIKLILITLMASAATILWRSLQSIFLGYKLIGDYNILQLFYTTAVFLINLVIIYILNLDLFAIVWNLVIISLLIIFIGGWKLKNILTEKASNKNHPNNKTVSLAVKATVASITMFMFLKGDLFIVNYFLDASITGIYSISLVFVDLLQKLPLVLGPLILAKSANKEFSTNLDEFARLFRILLVFNFGVVLFLFLFGNMIITYLFTAEFSQSYYLLVIILPSLIFFGSGHMIHAYFMGQGYPAGVLIINIFSAAFNFILNITLIPLYGIKIAAAICSATYLLWAILFVVYLVRKTSLIYKELFMIKVEDFEYLIQSVRKSLLKNG